MHSTNYKWSLSKLKEALHHHNSLLIHLSSSISSVQRRLKFIWLSTVFHANHIFWDIFWRELPLFHYCSILHQSVLLRIIEISSINQILRRKPWRIFLATAILILVRNGHRNARTHVRIENLAFFLSRLCQKKELYFIYALF